VHAFEALEGDGGVFEFEDEADARRAARRVAYQHGLDGHRWPSVESAVASATRAPTSIDGNHVAAGRLRSSITSTTTLVLGVCCRSMLKKRSNEDFREAGDMYIYIHICHKYI